MKTISMGTNWNDLEFYCENKKFYSNKEWRITTILLITILKTLDKLKIIRFHGILNHKYTIKKYIQLRINSLMFLIYEKTDLNGYYLVEVTEYGHSEYIKEVYLLSTAEKIQDKLTETNLYDNIRIVPMRGTISQIISILIKNIFGLIMK